MCLASGTCHSRFYGTPLNGASLIWQDGEVKNQGSFYKAKKIERRWFVKQGLIHWKIEKLNRYGISCTQTLWAHDVRIVIN